MKRLVFALAVVGASLSVSADASPSHAQAKKKASGDLSTIVINAVSGGSAAGMIIELYEISGAKPRKIIQVSTGEDGRADLISSRPLPLGKYELRFQVGDYFRKQSGRQRSGVAGFRADPLFDHRSGGALSRAAHLHAFGLHDLPGELNNRPGHCVWWGSQMRNAISVQRHGRGRTARSCERG